MWFNIGIWYFELFLSYWWIIICWWMMSRKNNLIQIQTINNDNHSSWLISDGDFKEFIPFGNPQGNTYKANQHSGHSTMTIAYSREDLVQIGNIVRNDGSLNRLPPNTCYKIRILRLNNIPKRRKQQRKRAGRCKNLAPTWT